MRRWPLVFCVLSACGAAPVPVAVPTPVPEPEPDLCAGATTLVVEAPDEIPSVWSGGSIVAGRANVRLRWCGVGTVVIDRIHLDTGNGSGAEWELDPALARLAHGESLEREIMGAPEPCELPLTVRARDEAGHPIEAHATIHAVLDPRFVAERDACLAAAGTFAPAGLSGNFTCERPTHDAGRRCLSSAECEGACLDARTEVTTTPPDGRTCPPGEEVRLHVGACASTTQHFGCRQLLSEVLTECALPGHVSRVHIVCVD